MAVLLSNISAASLINLADSTSALAEINFDSANLLSLAADDNVSYKSFESLISFIYIFSTLIPLLNDKKKKIKVNIIFKN